MLFIIGQLAARPAPKLSLGIFLGIWLLAWGFVAKYSFIQWIRSK
jgi:hypothetical protein